MKAVVFESLPEINGFVEKLVIFFVINQQMNYIQLIGKCLKSLFELAPPPKIFLVEKT